MKCLIKLTLENSGQLSILQHPAASCIPNQHLHFPLSLCNFIDVIKINTSKAFVFSIILILNIILWHNILEIILILIVMKYFTPLKCYVQEHDNKAAVSSTTCLMMASWNRTQSARITVRDKCF
jgi:hypothetical protein